MVGRSYQLAPSRSTYARALVEQRGHFNAIVLSVKTLEEDLCVIAFS